MVILSEKHPQGWNFKPYTEKLPFIHVEGQYNKLKLWPNHNARQLSLYWEGDLRNPSYFLNKRKELEFFYLKSCRSSIFSLICERESDQNNRITGKITKISAGICRKWFSDWEKKPFHPFSLLLSRWHFYGKILLIFCEFLRPILAWQEQRKWCLVFFHQEGHIALLQKNYQTKPCQFGIYTKSFSYLVQWVSEILIYKVSQL